MTSASFDLAAGIDSVVTHVTSVWRLLVSAVAAIILDSEGKVSIQSAYQIKDSCYSGLESVVWWLGLTPLQTSVLRALIIILFVNCCLITLFWYIYSHRISHTLSFNSLRIVEDILKRNTNFKLPKDHGGARL